MVCLKTPLFLGLATALVTPFAGDRIDFAALERLLEYQYLGGAAAVLAAGTTGEAPTLSAAEWEELVSFCCRKAGGKMKVLAGVGGNDTRAVLRRAELAAACGADGILMSTPYYNKTTQAGLLRHFFTVADRVDLPLILYNVPARTGMTVTPETYELLSRHPRIAGVKEASGDLRLVSRVRALCGEELPVWSGIDADTVAMMALGAKGVVSVAANVAPQETALLCRLCLAGRFEDARRVSLRLEPLTEALFCEVNPIPVKAALRLMGVEAGSPRLPLVEATPACRERRREAMGPLGLLAAG